MTVGRYWAKTTRPAEAKAHILFLPLSLVPARMPADGDDPALLFTPPRRRSTAPSSVLSEVPATSTEGGRDSDAPDLRVDSGDDDAPFCVQVPRMTTKEKEKYVDGQFSDSDDDSEAGIVELVGEYHLGSMVFIYALHKDTIYRRVRKIVPLRTFDS